MQPSCIFTPGVYEIYSPIHNPLPLLVGLHHLSRLTSECQPPTNGRAYATVLRPSVVCLSVSLSDVCGVGYVLWLNGTSCQNKKPSCR